MHVHTHMPICAHVCAWACVCTWAPVCMAFEVVGMARDNYIPYRMMATREQVIVFSFLFGK